MAASTVFCLRYGILHEEMSGNIYRALLGWMANNNTRLLYFVVFEIKEMTLGHGLDGSGHQLCSMSTTLEDGLQCMTSFSCTIAEQLYTIY